MAIIDRTLRKQERFQVECSPQLVRNQRALRVQARESSSLAPLRCFLRGQGAIRAKEFLITLWKAQITRSTLQLDETISLFISRFSLGLTSECATGCPN